MLCFCSPHKNHEVKGTQALKHLQPCAGSGVNRIDPLHFLARCCKWWLNQVLSVLSLSTGFLNALLLFIRALFVLTSDCISMVLVKLSVLAKWLARKRLLWGSLFVVRLSPQSPGRRVLMTFSVLCIVLLCVYHYCPPALHNIFHTPMARCSLLMLKVLLNTNLPVTV